MAQGTCHLELLPDGLIQYPNDNGERNKLGKDSAADGALLAASGGLNSRGLLTLFERQGTDWVFLAEMEDPSIFNLTGFGDTIDVSDGRVIVGAADTGQKGAAWVFEESLAGVWEHEKLLFQIPNGFKLSDFGSGVSIDGDLCVVGDNGYYEEGVPGALGAAFVFERTTTGWEHLQTLLAADGEYNTSFGREVAIRGDLIAVGAPFDHWDGTVHMFERVGGTWVETQEIRGSDTGGMGIDGFGSEIALSATELFVGWSTAKLPPPDCGDFEDCKQGGTWVYEKVNGTWVETQALYAPEPQYIGRFGFDLDVQGETLAVTEWAFPPSVLRAHVFTKGIDGWEVSASLSSPMSDTLAFGYSVAVAHNEVLVADYLLDSPNTTGAGALVRFSTPQVQSFCPSEPNSTGAPAELRTTPCFQQGSLQLSAAPLPDGQPGLFFYGQGEATLPFGDGTLCLTGDRFRLPVAQSSGGTLSQALAFDDYAGTAGEFLPGSTWSFQTWFRDPAAGQSGFQFSSAVRVHIAP